MSQSKMILKWTLCIFLLTNNLNLSESLPVVTLEKDDFLSDFEDNWVYEVKPHNFPLLNITSKYHTLPPSANEISLRSNEEESTEPQKRRAKKVGDASSSKIPCPVCRLAIGLLMKEIKKGTEFNKIKETFVQLCVGFKIQTEPICSSVFEVFGPEVIPAFNRTKIGIPEICNLLMGESCGEVKNPLHEWEIDFPKISKPKLDEPALPKMGLPTFKVLHLTDTHYDSQYEEGSISNCAEPLCCRKSSTPGKEKIIPAGRWGAYSTCDSPRNIIEHLLKHISEQHPDIDFIIWTGDLPAHDIWNQTKESNLNIIQDTSQQMFTYFPNTPIFPSIGNHESTPAGTFQPPWVDDDHSIMWLYRELANQWRQWLPASVGNTILHGGFYSTLLRPKFRLISINSNYCHTLNWWLIVNSTDPAKELKWLTFELQQAEDNKEKVMIIGHIAPGSKDCLKTWSHNFNKLVERYENTIVAQFYGHSHADEFEVFYDSSEHSRPTNVAYLGPSVTSFENFNPAYRIYYLDGDHDNTTREVIDHETWTMDLEHANKNGEPEWYKLYSARNAFQMESLRPREWSNLIDRMIENENLFNEFYKFYYRDSPARPPCDEPKCKLHLLCDLRSGRSHSRRSLCHDLELAIGS